MMLQWSNYSNRDLNFSAVPLSHSRTYATLDYTISKMKLSDAGQFNCSSFIDTTTYNPYILTSDTMNNMANVSIISK